LERTSTIQWWKRDLECPKPTAEEKIVALEAKLNSTVKNLNKKVATEWGKTKGAAKKKDSTDKGKSKKKDGKLGEPQDLGCSKTRWQERSQEQGPYVVLVWQGHGRKMRKVAGKPINPKSARVVEL
jgi:hypothetical protein